MKQEKNDPIDSAQLRRTLFRARQITSREAKGAFTPHRQLFGKDASTRAAEESTFCMVLAKTRHWFSRHVELKALHAMVINQLAISGLRCVRLPENRQTAAAGVVLIGIKATKRQLLKEFQQKQSENIFRSTSIIHSRLRSRNRTSSNTVGGSSINKKGSQLPATNIAASPSIEDIQQFETSLSPADEILLTQRILHRALEVLRVRQGESKKYIHSGQVSFFTCFKRSCFCCERAQRYDPLLSDAESYNDQDTEEGPDAVADKLLREPLTLSGGKHPEDRIIRDVFALHDRRVNYRLWHLFLRELNCGNYCARMTKFDEYPMLRFCDEVRYHHGNEVAVFFAFAAYTLMNLFIVSLVATVIGLSLLFIVHEDLQSAATAALGLAVLLIWAPIYIRMWDREYAVLVVRWDLDEGDRLHENPHDPKFEWAYDSRLRRRVREYDASCRPLVTIVFIPLAFVFLLLAMIDQSLFAIWGAHMMTLPNCADCNQMMDIVALGETAFDAMQTKPAMPYDRYWYGEDTTFAASRSYDEFVFGWQNTNPKTQNQTCLPDYCDQVSFWFGTCWDAPRGLLPATANNEGEGIGSPFFPFILFTVILMRPISSIFQGIYDAVIRALTKLENWPTLGEYTTAYTRRKFAAYFVDVFWFNMVIVFFLVRFGPAVMYNQLELCTGTDVWAIQNETDGRVQSLQMQPHHYSSRDNFIDFLYEIPFSEYDLTLGIWNPTNVLITGEWVGLTFDLVILRLNFLTMLFWCGFFPHTILKCKRCRRKHCCPKLQERSRCLKICCSTQDIDDGIAHEILDPAQSICASELRNADSTKFMDEDMPRAPAIFGIELNSMDKDCTHHKDIGREPLPVISEEACAQVPEATSSSINLSKKKQLTRSLLNQLLVAATKKISHQDEAALDHLHLQTVIEEQIDRQLEDTEKSYITEFLKSLPRNCKANNHILNPWANPADLSLNPQLECEEGKANTPGLPGLDKLDHVQSNIPSSPPQLRSRPLSGTYYDPTSDVALQTSMDVLASVDTVNDLRGYHADELLRIANLQQLNLNDGAISHLKVVSHATSVMMFTIFFPLMVPIVCMGLMVDMIAEVTGLLGASKYTVLPYTGEKSVEVWRWSMTVSLFISVPLVFSYFCFQLLEILQCQNAELYDDGSTGDFMNVGQTFCFDANFNNWYFNHSPYAVAWLALSLLSFIWISIIFSLLPATPDIVTRERKICDTLLQSQAEDDEVAHGLDVARVPQLRTIYAHADAMPRMPGHGTSGDGDVPLCNLQAVVTTLMSWHQYNEGGAIPGSRKSLAIGGRPVVIRTVTERVAKQNNDMRKLEVMKLIFDADGSDSIQFVEFALGIRTLRTNGAHLALFGVSTSILDQNIVAYASSIEDANAARSSPKIRQSRALLQRQYNRLSLARGKLENLKQWQQIKDQISMESFAEEEQTHEPFPEQLNSVCHSLKDREDAFGLLGAHGVRAPNHDSEKVSKNGDRDNLMTIAANDTSERSSSSDDDETNNNEFNTTRRRTEDFPSLVADTTDDACNHENS